MSAHSDFTDSVAAATAAHAEALKASTRAFNTACQETQSQWEITRNAVRSRYDAVKSTPEHPDFAAAQKALHELPRAPGTKTASDVRFKANAEADRQMAEALARARAQLAAAPALARHPAR
jgi:hypothetical protein